MLRASRLAHIVGVVMAVGSISTFLVVSAVIDGGPVEGIALGRRIISTGTNVLTLPGLGLVGGSGLWMGWRRYGPRHRFFRLKLLLAALIAANGLFFVVPSVARATEIAVRSLAQGRLQPEYGPAYVRESAFGAANVVLLLTAVVLGVWRAGAASGGDARSAAAE